MNDVWSFNTTTMEWNEIKTTGDVPSHRSNCSMSYDSENDRIVVFGGGGPNKKRFNTINVLNWITKEWIEIPPKGLFPLIQKISPPPGKGPTTPQNSCTPTSWSTEARESPI